MSFLKPGERLSRTISLPVRTESNDPQPQTLLISSTKTHGSVWEGEGMEGAASGEAISSGEKIKLKKKLCASQIQNVQK